MELPSGAEFVESVMQALEVTGPTALTRRMGWDINTPSLIKKWTRGTSAPSYEYVMQMLDACGWLNMSGEAPQPAPQQLNPLGRLEAVAEANARSIRNLTATVESLLSGIEDRLTALASQVQTLGDQRSSRP